MGTIPEHLTDHYMYHMTHLDNLPGILSSGGILCTNALVRQNLGHHNVALEDIQKRRDRVLTDGRNKLTIHDYVPFYFTTRSKMLLSILNRRVADQYKICYLAVPITHIAEKGVRFSQKYVNTVAMPEIYDDPADLDKLRWDLIDSRNWSVGQEDNLYRMAEALVPEEVPVSWISDIIVFDARGENAVRSCFTSAGVRCPEISREPFSGKFFYFRKFFLNGRENESLITGPDELYDRFEQTCSRIQNARITSGYEMDEGAFTDIRGTVSAIGDNFCALPELAGIDGLATTNSVHQETVSEHTRTVVRMLEQNLFYGRLDRSGKQTVTLAAYLHDIGKGPKEKWENGIQKPYQDHPADALPMLESILSRRIQFLRAAEIRQICLLVAYHDLMGGIVGKERSIEELKRLQLKKNELDMLAALSAADVSALGNSWGENFEDKLEELIGEVSGET